MVVKGRRSHILKRMGSKIAIRLTVSSVVCDLPLQEVLGAHFYQSICLSLNYIVAGNNE
jgi:hypothetical protein